jgi:hypothetical protein
MKDDEYWVHRFACLDAGICPNCGSSLRNVTKWYHPVTRWLCIVCDKRYFHWEET